MATLTLNLTSANAVIGYGYSGSPNTAYIDRDFFKVGRQSGGEIARAAISVLDESLLALRGIGAQVTSATLQAYSYNRGNEWTTPVPVEVDGCTNANITTSTTYNSIPSPTFTGVVSTIRGWNTYCVFDVTNVVGDILSDADNTATFILYQTTTTNSTAKAFYETNASYPIKLIVEYTVPATVGAPTNVKLNVTETRDTATLSWNAGTNNTLNSVTGYEVQYSDDNGSTWNALTTLGVVTSLTVNAPARGVTRLFRVRTLGSAGEMYYSAWTQSSNSLSLQSGTGQLCIGGVWKEAQSTSICINNTWYTVIGAKTCINGSWREIGR